MECGSFFRACPDLLCLVGFDGRLREFSAAWAAALGYERGELLGRAVLELVHPDDRVHTRTWTRRLLRKSRGPVAFENRCLRKDGAWLRLWWQAAVVPGERLVCASARDITDRHIFERELQEQLFLAQKLETAGRLVGAVAHDLNNFLTAIGGCVAFLLRDLSPGDPRRADVEAIQEASGQIALLARQLLNFCRRRADRRLQPVPLDSAIDDIKRLLRCIVGQDIRLDVRLGAAGGEVSVDPGELAQVVVNLAANARDAMPRGGDLTVETFPAREGALRDDRVPPGAYIVLSVRDTGHGMDQETLANIFRPFFTTKARDQGCGLGLATVAKIVESSGGAVRVESRPGQGTRFKVYWRRV